MSCMKTSIVSIFLHRYWSGGENGEPQIFTEIFCLGTGKLTSEDASHQTHRGAGWALRVYLCHTLAVSVEQPSIQLF